MIQMKALKLQRNLHFSDPVSEAETTKIMIDLQNAVSCKFRAFLIVCMLLAMQLINRSANEYLVRIRRSVKVEKA